MKRPGPPSVISLAAAIAVVLGTKVRLHAETIVLDALKDNTLYEVGDQFSALSNALGAELFAGNTGPTGGISKRRGLLAFDVVGNLPEGATIDAVTLQLKMSKTVSGSQTVGLHRLNADWGEGTSKKVFQPGQGAPATLGDATWFHTFFNTESWTNPGGDFQPTPSASQSVGGLGFYTWTSPGLVDDVQGWLDDGSNFGWLLMGNESNSATAKQFQSREAADAADRPKLTVEFSLDLLSSDLTGNGFVDFEDLTVLLANWNKQVVADAGNLVNADTTPVNFEDLTVLLADWTGPAPAGSPEAALATEAVPEPSALVLVGMGLAVISLWRRSKAPRHAGGLRGGRATL